MVAPSVGVLITTAVAVGVAGDGGALGVVEVPPAAPPPKVELEPGGVVLVVVVDPGAALPVPVVGVPPLARLVVVKLPAELLKPLPEPPQPTIAPSKNKENRRTPCRI
jgi:hypothetical protein